MTSPAEVAAANAVERPDLWHCAACTTAYAVGLPACPHCGSTARAGAEVASPPAPPAASVVKEKEVTNGPDHGGGAQ